MKINNILQLESYSERRAGYTKHGALSIKLGNVPVTVYRAQPKPLIGLDPGSYITRSLRFAKEHAVSSANYEDQPFYVIKIVVNAEHVFNADNPGEYVYDGPTIEGTPIFSANPGDDFDIIEGYVMEEISEYNQTEQKMNMLINLLKSCKFDKLYQLETEHRLISNMLTKAHKIADVSDSSIAKRFLSVYNSNIVNLILNYEDIE